MKQTEVPWLCVKYEVGKPVVSFISNQQGLDEATRAKRGGTWSNGSGPTKCIGFLSMLVGLMVIDTAVGLLAKAPIHRTGGGLRVG